MLFIFVSKTKGSEKKLKRVSSPKPEDVHLLEHNKIFLKGWFTIFFLCMIVFMGCNI